MSVKSDSQQAELTLKQAAQMFEQQAAVGSRSQQSVGTYMNGVKALQRWCAEQGYQSVGDLNKRNMGAFNPWLSEIDGWTNPYKQSITTGVRQFIKFLEERDELPRRTHELIKYHPVPKSERQSDNEIAPERVEQIIDYMETYFPCHRDTVLIKILYNTTTRCCGLHSLDVGDVRLDDIGRPEIAVRNRPPETKLKRGDDHERNIPITTELYERISEYVEHHHSGETDEYGRLPLIESCRGGRLAKSSIQDRIYVWTCPPYTGQKCLCCSGKPPVDEVVKCEESVGPHAIRGAAITRWFNAGKSADDISIVAAADGDILKQHYDKGDMADKADRARSLLDVL